jgi:hypothetical protein
LPKVNFIQSNLRIFFNAKMPQCKLRHFVIPMVRLSNHFLEDLEKLTNIYKNSDFFELLESQYKLDDFKNEQMIKSEVSAKKRRGTRI